jgi:CAAX protease family protein
MILLLYRMSLTKQKSLRALECMFLFFILPVAAPLFRKQIAFKVIPLTVIISVFCILLLWRDPAFDCRRLISIKGLSAHLWKIIGIFIPAAGALGFLTYYAYPNLFLAFPIRHPVSWALLMILYPPFAAYSQEIIFRSWFFHRYAVLFASSQVMVMMSALSFGLAHLFYGNWVAPVIASAGGVIFGYRYLRTDCLTAVALEHGLWGDFLFSIGIGWFLYSGQIR